LEKSMRWIAILACAAALAGSVPMDAQAKPAAQAAASAAPQAAAKSLLPDAFDGWVLDGVAKTVTDPAQADGANAAALKEYGLQSAVEATYKRDDETLTIKALEFEDVTGSYGAFSFYRGNDWPKEDIGAGAASDHNRVVFWRGATMVDANFSAIHPESAAELRELAKSLTDAHGNKGVMPPILDLLPKQNLDAQAMHYALGAASYTGAGGVLPADLVGFDLEAETVTANYSLTSGPATLTLIEYPTPQMAAAQAAKIAAYIHGGGKTQPFTSALTNSDQASLEVRHTGPVVALVSGDAIPDESHKLVEMVHYSSDLTALPQPGESDVQKTSTLLINIAMFVLVVGGAAIVLGFLVGGGRAFYRVLRGKPASSVYEEEFTKLDLKD
jgi:hypothetical protein